MLFRKPRRARKIPKRVCLIRQERFYIIRKRILSFSERGSGETLFTKRVSPDKHFSEKIINALVSFSGKGQGKTALYKEGFSLENFSEENYRKDFSVSRKGVRGEPSFQRGFSPTNTSRKNYKCVFKFLGKAGRGAETPLCRKRGFRPEVKGL